LKRYYAAAGAKEGVGELGGDVVSSSPEQDQLAAELAQSLRSQLEGEFIYRHWTKGQDQLAVELAQSLRSQLEGELIY